MTSAPYQSNVLRFFARQYWQGLARHRKAVRQTRYTVVSTVQVGGVLSSGLARSAMKVVRKTVSNVQRLLPEPVKALVTVTLSGEDSDSALVRYVKWGQRSVRRWFGTGALVSNRAVSTKLTTPGETVVLAVAEGGDDLAVPTVSFWVEVLRVVAWLKRKMGRSWRLAGQHLQLPDGAPWLKGDTAAAKLKSAARGRAEGAIVRRRGSAFTRFFSLGKLEAYGCANSQDYVEASVVMTSYVEHPLEKVLNWVDRCLVWLEDWWWRLSNRFI